MSTQAACRKSHNSRIGTWVYVVLFCTLFTPASIVLQDCFYFLLSFRSERCRISTPACAFPYEPAQSPRNIADGAAGANRRARLLGVLQGRKYRSESRPADSFGLPRRRIFRRASILAGVGAQHVAVIVRRMFGTLLAIIGIQLLLSQVSLHFPSPCW